MARQQFPEPTSASGLGSYRLNHTPGLLGPVTSASAQPGSLKLLIGQQATVDGVRQSAFQAPQRFFGGLALGQLALVIGLPSTRPADLDHRHHVQGVIQLAVPGPRQPVADDLAAGGLQWGGAGVGAEII
jgi:hypothetical protein